MAEAPRITYYARVIDNSTNSQLVNTVDAMENNVWYYGKCSKLKDGESQYIVEFDIWNNEPAFNANTYDTACEDAVNCRLTVEKDQYYKSSKDLVTEFKDDSFMYVKDMTNGYDRDFVKISDLTNITGNMNPARIGVLQGRGDHTKIQTKIKIPKDSTIEAGRYSFIFAFYYDFE